MLNDIYTNSFIKCLNESRFYDAHEVLEEIWYPRRFDDNDEIKLLKGFINASVSFELIKRGRRQRAKTPWRTYLKYRQLLFKIKEKKANYYKLSRHVEMIQRGLKNGL